MDKFNRRNNIVARSIVGNAKRSASLYTIDDIKSIIKDLKKNLEDELTDESFSDVEEVKGFIREKLLDAMYMTEDTANLAAYYIDADTLRKLFYKQFVKDVVEQLGDLNQYVAVKEPEETEEPSIDDLADNV